MLACPACDESDLVQRGASLPQPETMLSRVRAAAALNQAALPGLDPFLCTEAGADGQLPQVPWGGQVVQAPGVYRAERLPRWVLLVGGLHLLMRGYRDGRLPEWDHSTGCVWAQVEG